MAIELPYPLPINSFFFFFFYFAKLNKAFITPYNLVSKLVYPRLTPKCSLIGYFGNL